MKRIVSILIFSLALISCEDQQQKLIGEINELTETMKNETYPSGKNMDRIVELYDEYIDNFPDEEETYTYMELKAKYLSANNKQEEALEAYDLLIAKYPDDSRAAEAVFMQAFILENYLLNKVRAQEKYSDFLKHYPNHELADDAQFSIQNLSLTDAELLEKLQGLSVDSATTQE